MGYVINVRMTAIIKRSTTPMKQGNDTFCVRTNFSKCFEKIIGQKYQYDMPLTIAQTNNQFYLCAMHTESFRPVGSYFTE